MFELYICHKLFLIGYVNNLLVFQGFFSIPLPNERSNAFWYLHSKTCKHITASDMYRWRRINTESIRKSRNITLSWTKIKYQNNLNLIALFSTLFIRSIYKLLPLITPTTLSYQSLTKRISKLTSYRHNLVGNHFAKSFSKPSSGIQWNFEICFRCSVLLEKFSFNKKFNIETKMFAIRCK